MVFPCCAAHLGWALLLSRPRVHPDPWRVGDSCAGSPLACVCPRKGEALPGYWVVLLSRAVVNDPAERAAVLPIADCVAVAFGTHQSLGARKPTVSRLCSRGPRLRAPTHRPRASLPPGARLATGLPGSTLAGRVSHPLDDFSEFHELPHVFIPFRPALPGRTVSKFVGGTRRAQAAGRGPQTLTHRESPTQAAARWSLPPTLPLTGTLADLGLAPNFPTSRSAIARRTFGIQCDRHRRWRFRLPRAVRLW